jgi:hypothetical protein
MSVAPTHIAWLEDTGRRADGRVTDGPFTAPEAALRETNCIGYVPSVTVTVTVTEVLAVSHRRDAYR